MGIIGKLIYSTYSSKDKVEFYQKIIRDKEWSEIKKEIPSGSYLLDVGCGAGYAIQKATEELNCKCIGIDPDPGSHGVGRYHKKLPNELNIIKGNSEKLPFHDKEFTVVFSSHVLEHVTDEFQSLKEMKRVMKDDAILIIGMPTALMAWINLFSQLFFTTHIKIYQFIREFFSMKVLDNLRVIFFIKSHSYPRAQSVLYDISHYRVNNWKKIISSEFDIIREIQPFLYPYPDFPQWFKIRKSSIGSSSVFFVCRKKP